jgi:fructose-1,6-bisphosphatase/inositol monophosphatase family enzyme
MTPDIDKVTRIIAEVAAEAVLPRFQALASHEIREKPAGDLVTIADVEAEALLEMRLAELLPGSRVVGEEAAEEDPEVLRHLAQEGDAVWVVDPVDGTGNFSRGVENFAMMVGLTRGEEILAGWIHRPVGGATAVAERGSGAWRDGVHLRVAEAAAPAEMRGTINAGVFGDKALGARIQSRRERVDAVKSLRCAGLEYVRLSSGETHFSLFTKLMPWDHVPGNVIHAEAGGYGRLLDGRRYTPQISEGKGLLLAPSEDAWDALHETLLEDEDVTPG